MKSQLLRIVLHHRNKTTLLAVLFGLILSSGLAGCGGQGDEGGRAVEAYLRALVAKDSNGVVNLSCAAWEVDARNELNSFGAVTPTLEDLDCEETGQEGEVKLVACTGKIAADYNGEILEINLADRSYQAVYEGGDWRFCGYR